MTDKIIRVFVRRTSYTPDNHMAYIGAPPIELPEHDEVHISCVFTWDKGYCRILQGLWQEVTNKPVKLGGPAFDSPAEDFVQGMYLKSNYIFTTRGCNNNCPWCCVPKREGSLRELPIVQGNIIQDNNFLQANKTHKNKVFDMLRTQKGICFKGGLEVDLIDDHFINNITSLRIKELWIACDTDTDIHKMRQAVSKLQASGFNRNKIYCYALIGDDMTANEERCREIYHAGAMPFAQLYQPFSEQRIKYGIEWERFCRMWSRPAAVKAHMERKTNWWEA